MFTLQHLDHIAIIVSDLQRSKVWYCDVLGMVHEFPGLWEGVPIMLSLGATFIALFPAQSEGTTGPTPQPPIRVAHFAFRADYPNFEAAQQTLTAKGIDFNFQDHDISHSIYFTDPDGHKLEITTYDLP